MARAIADRIALRRIREETFGTTPVAELLAKTTVGVLAGDDSYNDGVEDLTVFTAGQTILVSGFTEAANNGHKTVVSSALGVGTDVGPIATINAETVDDSYNDAVADISGFIAGETILVSGFTDPLNNGLKTVVSSTANKLVVSENLADEVIGDNVTILSCNKMIVREALTDEDVGDTVSVKSAMRELRLTSESLTMSTDIAESAEIRDDRQVADVKRTGISAGGDVGVEMSYGAYDDLIEAALMSSAWSTEVELSNATLALLAADNSINDTDTSPFVTAGFTADQWIKVSGFTGDVANNGYYKIVSVIAAKMVLEGKTCVDDVKGETVTVTMGGQVTNGTVKHHYSIEREYKDLASEFAIYTGMALDTMSLDVSAGAIITGAFAFIGKDEDSKTATACTGTPEEAAENDVMASIDEVEGVLENLGAQSVVSFSLEVANNLRALTNVAELGPVDVGAGKVAVSGALEVYLESKTLMDKYIDQTPSNLTLILEDAAGNGYVFDLPQVRYTSGERAAGGENTDIVASMAFSAYRDEDEGVTIRIARFPA